MRSWKFKSGDNLGNEKPVSEGTADEVGVFPGEPKTGALGEIAFEERAGIDIPETFRFWSADGVHEFGEFFQAWREDVVIIGVLCVAGD